MYTMRMIVLGSAVATASAINGHYLNSTTTTDDVVYTTEVVTALTTYCPAPTTITHGTKTYTVTKPTTLTITDCPCTISKPVSKSAKPTHTPTPTPGDECAKNCNDAYNKCRVAPSSNQAACASEYAACLGYNPFAGNGTAVTPTACSKVVYTTEVVTAITTYCPAPTTITHGSKTYTVTTPTTLTITDCPCTISKPVKPTSPVSPPSKDCAEMCYDAYNMCRGKSGANFAVCGSEFAGCLGYNPFSGSNGTLVKPTACSSGSTGPKPTGPVPTGPVPTGPEPTGPVPTGPGHTGPEPTGPVPTGTSPGNPPVVTAGAAAVVPAKVLLGLGAMGAFALL